MAALCVFVFWLSQRGWRDPMQVFGLQVAALTALAVFFPHLYWLIEHNFEPLGYAMSSRWARTCPGARVRAKWGAGGATRS